MNATLEDVKLVLGNPKDMSDETFEFCFKTTLEQYPYLNDEKFFEAVFLTCQICLARIRTMILTEESKNYLEKSLNAWNDWKNANKKL